MVLVSTAGFILSTLPQFQQDGDYFALSAIFVIIDQIAVYFFTFEYAIRLLCAPRKFRFVLSPMNMIDLLAILPFFLTLMLNHLEDFKIIGKAGKIIRLIRVLRIMRIFKLARHFNGLQCMVATMQEAYKELGLLALMVTFQAFLFAIFVFMNEKDSEQPWTLFDSAMWGILTVSTVGSNNQQPASLIGKFIGGLCPITGVILLTLPVPIIVNSFADNYRNRICRTEVRQRKETAMDSRRKSAIGGFEVKNTWLVE